MVGLGSADLEEPPGKGRIKWNERGSGLRGRLRVAFGAREVALGQALDRDPGGVVVGLGGCLGGRRLLGLGLGLDGRADVVAVLVVVVLAELVLVLGGDDAALGGLL